jgi:hypothetical protein
MSMYKLKHNKRQNINICIRNLKNNKYREKANEQVQPKDVEIIIMCCTMYLLNYMSNDRIQLKYNYYTIK